MLGMLAISWLLAKLTGSLVVILGWYGIATIAILAPYMIAMMRTALLGSKGVEGRSSYVYGTTEKRYFIANLLLVLADLGPLAAAIAIGYYGGSILLGALISIPAAAAGLLLGVRVALIFPAIALDRYDGIVACWRRTRESFWRLLAISLIVASPFYVFSLITQRVVKAQVGFSYGRIAFFQTVVNMLAFAAIASARAFAYEFLTTKSPPPDPPN